MSWRDLLQSEAEKTLISPWVGGRSLRTYDRYWKIEGGLPQDFGWHQFRLVGPRRAHWAEPTERPANFQFKELIRGYLVGDRLVPDQVRIDSPERLAAECERVHLLESGLDRFVRVIAGRAWENGPLIYDSQDFPLGPENEVLSAYLDDETSVNHITGVAPALDAAFRFEVWQRAEARRRREEERRRREEEERRRQAEERRQQIIEQLGDGAVRREMARIDFAEAARAALAISGAEYLDHRQAHRRNEMIIRFRLNHQRYECVCDNRMRIIDAGICLTNETRHEVFGIAPGESGGNLFTLESLPGVILEAERNGHLVVFRHVD